LLQADGTQFGVTEQAGSGRFRLSWSARTYALSVARRFISNKMVWT
jgi:hypothetical protein